MCLDLFVDVCVCKCLRMCVLMSVYGFDVSVGGFHGVCLYLFVMSVHLSVFICICGEECYSVCVFVVSM